VDQSGRWHHHRGISFVFEADALPAPKRQKDVEHVATPRLRPIRTLAQAGGTDQTLNRATDRGSEECHSDNVVFGACCANRD